MEETLKILTDRDNWAIVYAEDLGQHVWAWVGPPEILNRLLNRIIDV